MKNGYKYICLAIAATLILSVSGCKKGLDAVGGEFKKTTSDEYPIKTNVTLKYYCNLFYGVSATASSLNETNFAKQLIEETGINVEFIHPTEGYGGDSFTLMIASNDLPDIIESSWYNYPGGAQKAIDEKIIIPLNQIIDSVSPNLSKWIEQKPEMSKMMTTDEGNYYMYPFIRGDEILKTFRGSMVRADLLEKTGLEEPETIEEWETMLKAFKKIGVEVPLALRLTIDDMIGGFGIHPGFYHDGNTVKYGYNEQGYRAYLTTLNSWYHEGLLDKNFTDEDGKRINSLMANGSIGAIFGSCGGEFGTWITSLLDKVPNGKYTPISYPTHQKGVKPIYGQKDFDVTTAGAAISGQCKNVELAARLLDYGYGEKGQLLYNFGEEGLSYTMKNGVPTYTDIVIDKEKNGGLSILNAISKYARSTCDGPFIQNKNYVLQYYSKPEQKEALPIWSNTDTDKYKMPYVSMTIEENKEFTKIMQDIDTFRKEQMYKYVIGKEDIGKMDNYFAELKNMGIDKAIQIQQSAYDRYLQR